MPMSVGDESTLWEQPLEEEYWRAILEQGEFAPEAGPPPDEEEFPSTETVVKAEGEEEIIVDREVLAEDWQKAQQCFLSKEILELPVIGYNRGGLLVKFNNLKGFVPLSQLSFIPYGLTPEERKAFLAQCVGETLQLRVIELDRERNRLVLSEREALLTSQGEELLNELQPGQVRKGKVTNVCAFGAFVDLGGIEGLIHVSELSWSRVEHPSQVLKPGQEVEVFVIDVNKEERKIALSLKRLQPDPWKGIEERYQVGQVLKGMVTNVVDFGAFVRVEDGIEGLVHVSELAEGNFMHPRNVVKEGDEVWVQVIEVDGSKRRLGLSMRRVPNSLTARR